MKKCATCSNDLPDAAAHCVFCGSKQPVAAAPAPVGARTVMGYSAAEVLANMQAAQATPQPQPFAASAPPPLITDPAMMSTLPVQPSPFGPPPPQIQLPPSNQAALPTMMAAPPVSAPLGRPRTAPPLQPQAPHSGLSSAGLPLPGALGPAYAAPVAPAYAAPVSPAYAPPAAPMPRPGSTMALDPAVAAAPIPLELMGAPRRRGDVVADLAASEPGAAALRFVLVLFGVLLLAAFATPLRLKPTSVMHWDALVAAPTTLVLLQSLLLVVGGALALAIALIPMGPLPRAVIAAGLGFTPLVVPLTLGDDVTAQAALSLGAAVTLVPGLLLRSVHRGSLAARVMVTVGAVLVLVAALVPVHDVVPLKAAIDALGTNRTLPAVFVLAPVVVALVALVCWLPATTSAAGRPLAWTFLLLPVIAHALLLLERGRIAEVAEVMPYPVLAGWIPGLAWAAILAHGIAVALGTRQRA